MEIPRPFAIAIDDMGWMEGSNQGYQGKGPYRVGLNRKMGVDDYLAVITLAQKVGVRLQGLFILGELDKENIVETIPTVVPKREYWKKGSLELQEQVMDVVKENAAHLEFGLHGVGHEYWPNDSNEFKRAEWYNLVDKVPWPEKSIRNHLDCFAAIMDQYGLSKENRHSFPESFVPCAYSYYWNPNPTADQYSLGAILREYGIKYANTDFAIIPEQKPPIDGGFDQGVHVMNRFNYGNLWHMIGQLPMIPIKYQSSDFIETHWPNLLAQDHFLQDAVTKKWADYYKEVNRIENRYCSKNTAQHHSQFLYRKYTKISKSGNTVSLDNSLMPKDDYHNEVAQNLVLKIPLQKGQHLNNIYLDDIKIPAYFENENFAYLYLPKLKHTNQVLTYQIGTNLPTNLVWHDSTCNIYSVFEKNQKTYIFGKYYGRQIITFLTTEGIESVTNNNPQLTILSWIQKGERLEMEILAADIQGEESSIIIQKKVQ